MSNKITLTEDLVIPKGTVFTFIPEHEIIHSIGAHEATIENGDQVVGIIVNWDYVKDNWDKFKQ